MFFEYLTLGDETTVSHSEIKENDGVEYIEVQFERPRDEGGFCSARCVLPSYKWIFNEYFTEKELSFFQEFLMHNAKLICG